MARGVPPPFGKRQPDSFEPTTAMDSSASQPAPSQPPVAVAAPEHNATMALDPEQIVPDDGSAVAAPLPRLRRELPEGLRGRRGKIAIACAVALLFLLIGLIARVASRRDEPSPAQA